MLVRHQSALLKAYQCPIALGYCSQQLQCSAAACSQSESLFHKPCILSLSLRSTQMGCLQHMRAVIETLMRPITIIATSSNGSTRALPGAGAGMGMSTRSAARSVQGHAVQRHITGWLPTAIDCIEAFAGLCACPGGVSMAQSGHFRPPAIMVEPALPGATGKCTQRSSALCFVMQRLTCIRRFWKH